ncbi:hypothetical protein [Roseovarius pelagicus]|uniref:Glycerol-3-phosphate dehydrogenase n=1 Tax=Roseovarius pelagicus TaxID=2980108 RepID=A0ABY6D9D8_9RHOB|nr:hypothetical protein [Roseovarius pelagicus]UXX82703.1 hypothetical protein N7U68_16680 [Roseovarius pelagicus]
MSDPVTNVEIEDVLSSIRRLVSNESRVADTDSHGGVSRPVARNKGDAETSDVSKLVLTPSFRVDETQREVPPEPESEQAVPEAEELRAPKERTEEVRESDENEAESQRTDNGHADDHDHLDVNQDDEEFDTDEAFDRAEEDHSTRLDDDEASDLDEHDHTVAVENTAPSDVASALKNRVAELEQAVAERSEQWEPDGASDDDYAGAAVEPLPWEDYVPSDTGGDADGNTQSDAAAKQSDAAESTMRSRGAFEVSEEAASTTTKPSQDSLNSDDTDTAEDFAEQELPLPEAADTEDRLEDDTARLLGLDEDSDAILDEDALRELVTEIVRQELQGGLGERITRNVRKLVRREIHRALASQELE